MRLCKFYVSIEMTYSNIFSHFLFFFSVSGDAEAVGSESVSHPTYVQYVEGDGSAYIPANGQM